MNAEIIASYAEESIERALSYKSDCATGKTLKTCIMNIEYCFGKYHAYMDILKMLDFDKFVELVNRYRESIDSIFSFIEKIYEL